MLRKPLALGVYKNAAVPFVSTVCQDYILENQIKAEAFLSENVSFIVRTQSYDNRVFFE